MSFFKKFGKSIKKGVKGVGKVYKKTFKGVKGVLDSDLARTALGTAGNVLLPGVGGAVVGKAYEIRDSLKTTRPPKGGVPIAPQDVEDVEQVQVARIERAMSEPEPLPEPQAEEPGWKRYAVPAGIAGGSLLLLVVLLRATRARAA